jgi:hypothetical protein
MTPETFVAALRAAVRKDAESEAKYYARPPSPNPPAHLARFSAWYRRLSPSDRRIAREVIRYSAEGSSFGLLTYLDNIAFLSPEGGTFELWHVGKRGRRTRLNDPDGQPLNELFNNVPEPVAQTDGDRDIGSRKSTVARRGRRC